MSGPQPALEVVPDITPTPSVPAAVSRCDDCQTPVRDTFCSACGQRHTARIVTLWQLLGEFFGELFSLDSKVWRTLKALALKPGLLSAEYVAGRRTRYTSPVKLYLFASVVFFLSPASYVNLGDSSESPVMFRLESGESKKLDVKIQTGVTFDGKVSEEERKEHELLAAEMKEVREKLEREKSFFAPIAAKIEKLLAAGPDALKGARKQIQNEFAALAPKLMFFLLPVFALLFKLLYVRTGRFYIEHLVFGLHFHAVGFLLLALAVTDWIEGIAILGSLLYLMLAMRRFYAQSWPATLAKFAVVFVVYGGTLSAGVAAMAVLGLLNA